MYAVEFEAQITNGHIVVPEELRQRLSGSLRVLVLVEADNGFSSAAYQGGGRYSQYRFGCALGEEAAG